MRQLLRSGVPLFDLLLRQSRLYWESQERRPPEALWQRGDVVPIEEGWYDDWTCMRRDGQLVLVEKTGDRDFPDSNHNDTIGRWMQQLPAASGYLRPEDPVMCPICEGARTTSRGEVCPCGGLGWMNRGPARDDDSE